MTGAPTNERPLNSWAKAGLIASTTAVIFLFYLFTLVTGLLLLALVFFELILVIALLRFGLASWAITVMSAHVHLISLLLKSLWLPGEGARYRIVLNEPSAPALFELVRALALKFAVQPPHEIQLEMSVNAWVQLKGYRSGAGATYLGLGYDLLAGLTVSEIEGVLAHEMAHAKLVQRGFKRFANGALGRCGRLVNALSAHVEEGRSAGKRRQVAESILWASDAIIRTLAKLVAAYSRQDEFEADRGAAEVCGSRPLRTSLLKLDTLSEASWRLPWRERVAQLQSGQSYSEWFAREITASLADGSREIATAPFDKFSTHPSLADRLQALPTDNDVATNEAPALGLLATPDATAEQLIAEIQRVSAQEEEKDTKALAKWKRRASSRTAFQPLQGTGIVIILVALVIGLISLFDSGTNRVVGVGIGLAFTALGVFLFRKGRYKDRRSLPIPPYSIFIHAREKKFDIDSQPALEKEFEALAASEKKKKRKEDLLVTEAYRALETCDYLRAHVAARICLKAAPKSIEGHLALAIAAAAVQQNDLAITAVQMVQHQTGLRTLSSAWGVAWALMLMQDWTYAEALLDSALALQPDNKNLLSCAALARARRGKLHSALAKAREVCTPSPPEKDQAILLISLLIDSGLLREAAGRAAPLENAAQTDADLQQLMVRLKLLQRAPADAKEWVERCRATDAKPARLMSLAALLAQSRQFNEAAALYDEVMAQGHFPEALLGRAQIDLERKEKLPARVRLFAALNLQATIPEGAMGPLPLFHAILGQLGLLQDLAHCSAWTATQPSTGKYHEALSNTTFLVFAPTQEEAARHVTDVLIAMEPAFQNSDLVWKDAPANQQPVRPVRPGIQNVTVGPTNR